MKNVKIFPKIELLVLVLILFAVVSSLTFEEKKQTLNGDWFVNMQATAGNDDGTTEADGWLTVDNIDWTAIGAGDRVFIISGNGTDYTLTNPISPPLDGITIIGIDGTNYGPTAYNINWNCSGFSKTRISHSSDHVVEINSTVCDFTAENIIFDNTSSTTYDETLYFLYTSDITLIDCEAYCDKYLAVHFGVVDGVYMDNCTCTSNDYVGLVFSTVYNATVENCVATSTDNSALSIHDSQYVAISKCSFETYDTVDRPLIEVLQSAYIDISDCSTEVLTNGDIDMILYIWVTQYSSFNRNKFHTVNSGVSCNHGIYIYNSCWSLEFDHNSIFGTFALSAVYDITNGQDIIWTNNTINNTSTGDGYIGSRTSGYALSAFVNNVIIVNSSSMYAIRILGTPSYWKPATGAFDYNCYYNLNVSGDFGYWNGCGATNDMNYWQDGSWTADEGNSVKANPNLAANGYSLTSTSPTAVLYSGTVSSCTTDIDGYGVPPIDAGKFSMGCDQATVIWYSCAYWSAGSGIYIPSWTAPPAYPVATLYLDCYGGASASLTNLTFTGTNAAYFEYVLGFSLPQTINQGTTESIDIRIKSGTASGTYDQTTADITYTGTASVTDNIALSYSF